MASYATKIDVNAGFCNDRQPSTSAPNLNGSGGTGTTQTYYAAYIRIFKNDNASNAVPSFKCNNTNDLFTLSNSIKGNKALSKPIALITVGEISYAGGVVLSNNTSYYLYNNQNYWTMSPFYARVTGNVAMFAMFPNGYPDYSMAQYEYGVRPVINLRSDVTLSGSGTTSSPYLVS